MGGADRLRAATDKRAVIFPAKRLADLGFDIWATEGTAEVLWRNGVHVTVVPRTPDEAADLALRGASRGTPTATRTVVERILGGELDLIVNTGGMAPRGLRSLAPTPRPRRVAAARTNGVLPPGLVGADGATSGSSMPGGEPA